MATLTGAESARGAIHKHTGVSEIVLAHVACAYGVL